MFDVYGESWRAGFVYRDLLDVVGVRVRSRRVVYWVGEAFGYVVDRVAVLVDRRFRSGARGRFRVFCYIFFVELVFIFGG